MSIAIDVTGLDSYFTEYVGTKEMLGDSSRLFDLPNVFGREVLSCLNPFPDTWLRYADQAGHGSL
jgi:hypothetical protein